MTLADKLIAGLQPGGSEQLACMCSFCRRMLDGGVWVQREPTPAEADNISHGVCPVCFEAEMQRIATHKRKYKR